MKTVNRQSVALQIINHFEKVTDIKYDLEHFQDLIEDTIELTEASVHEAKLIIEMKQSQWRDFASGNVTPSILFKLSNFTNYLFELKTSEPELMKLSISKVGLKHGDELTIENTIEFLDKSSYTIKRITTNSKGEVSSLSGETRPILGSSLKKWLLMESQNSIRDNRFYLVDKEFIKELRIKNLKSIM